MATNGHVTAPTSGPYEGRSLDDHVLLNHVANDDDEKEPLLENEVDNDVGGPVTGREAITVAVLTIINLLNYMDRYTIAGVLKDVQTFYGIGNSESGLLQSSFIISYMIFSLLFGYLGDRFSRKWIMVSGILFWSAITLASSFIPSHHFRVFLLMRALVGVGEASYSTIAPTVIADLFASNRRTMMMSIFYFAMPVGSGLGYIVGAKVAEALGPWQWSLRVTPCFGVVCVALTVFLIKDPRRGAADGGTRLEATSWTSDIKYLLRHRSFMLTSAGCTCVAFVTGALAFWAPIYIYKALMAGYGQADSPTISLVFGALTIVAGLVGVAFGSFSASKLRQFTGAADPLVCACTQLAAAPFLYFAIILPTHNVPSMWVAIFIGETFVACNFALVADIVMYVVVPTRRSSAEAVQILMQHALGDAISPFLVGALSDGFHHRAGYSEYVSLQYATFMMCFMCVAAGAFFIASAIYVEQDRNKTDFLIADSLVEDNDRET